MNVKKSPYNAAGNGIADDSVAIQMAINDAAKAGGTVKLPGGRYLISRPLRWTSRNVFLVGDGATRIIPSANFAGAAPIIVGASTPVLMPTEGGGIENLSIDLTVAQDANIAGVVLLQAWFTRIALLRVFNANGLEVPKQTGLLLHGGGGPNNAPMSNWCSNISVYDLQVRGSFKYSVRHSAEQGGTVNGTNYFGGFAFGNRKPGSVGFYIDDGAGDTTRVYGMALEDFQTGVYVGSQNNGPMDFRIEDCDVPYATAKDITFTVPAVTTIK